jgi:hypothetical protein
MMDSDSHTVAIKKWFIISQLVIFEVYDGVFRGMALEVLDEIGQWTGTRTERSAIHKNIMTRLEILRTVFEKLEVLPRLGIRNITIIN